MIRRALTALAVAGAVLAASAPASATCEAGRIGVDPRTGKVIIEPPRCNPPPP